MYDVVAEMSFEDDLALMVEASNKEDLFFSAYESLYYIKNWIRKHILELIPNKLEIVGNKTGKK